MPIETDTVEVVGTSISLGGRSCIEHYVCGEDVSVDDVLIFRKGTVLIEGAWESCVKVFKIRNGQQSCHVGFLPRYLRHSWFRYHDKRAIVTEDLRFSNNLIKANKSGQMGGIVKAKLIKNQAVQGESPIFSI